MKITLIIGFAFVLMAALIVSQTHAQDNQQVKPPKTETKDVSLTKPLEDIFLVLKKLPGQTLKTVGKVLKKFRKILTSSKMSARSHQDPQITGRILIDILDNALDKVKPWIAKNVDEATKLIDNTIDKALELTDKVIE
ncbi:hypothetical protein WDU94_002570 [Cyamophila willieti]